VEIEASATSWLMHLDNAVSYLYDDSNDDILVQITIGAVAPPQPSISGAAVAAPSEPTVPAPRDFALVGTLTNTTNPQQAVSADAVISFDKWGGCILKISPPLYGSGTCSIKTLDQKSGNIEIMSRGALVNIHASGTVSGGFISGSYSAESPSIPELPQSGTFHFAMAGGLQNPLRLSDVLSWDTVKSGDQEFLVIREGSLVSVHQKDGTYAGRRLILDQGGNPIVVIEDSSTASVYRDFKTKAVLMTWVRDGNEGYFMRPNSGGMVYLDRFLQPTGWSSIGADKQTVFVHDVNGDFELFDGDMKPLGIRSGKTPSGQIYWAKTTGNITEFLDQSFKSLGWSSALTKIDPVALV